MFQSYGPKSSTKRDDVAFCKPTRLQKLDESMARRPGVDHDSVLLTQNDRRNRKKTTQGARLLACLLAFGAFVT